MILEGTDCSFCCVGASDVLLGEAKKLLWQQSGATLSL
jgi:hypothetical protein